VLDKTHHFEQGAIRWLLDMNFLHYAIFMFVVCAVVLVIVSYQRPAPTRENLAGLTFATAAMKLETSPLTGVHLEKETQLEHRLNVFFSLLLVATVVGLWIYFR
jgi:SSS family solute:Na+ symporter